MSGSPATAAKRGVGILFSATKSGLSAFSSGISKARKGFANKHETGVLDELRKMGLTPADHLYEAFMRLYYLYLAGYKHELVSAGQQAGKRLTEVEKSSVPLEAVILLGHAVYEETLTYGDFQKGKYFQGIQEFMIKSNMGKDHVDRDSISHDIYYAVLIAAETCGLEYQDLGRVIREAASRVVGYALRSADGKKDARTKKAAKALFLFASQIKVAAKEAELKKQKALKEAENLLRKEQNRLLRISTTS
ncbi:hypothetical protein O6H91_11G091800 [Diphasiastrum complanatum]|uniref:Uncharacterized protein n=1 Tax=Diphasiastrum complanatum TaxID=34168 RepID=A0ACC2CBP0_DIPCM|nr:hypothetical protein O6H91_11G091800 [Diphasiastrum complanatum]